MTILIKNGLIADGTGSPSYSRDVLIKDDKIVEIGPNLIAEGSEIIDASNRIVAPGFIDMHNHSDLTLFQSYKIEPYILQGCTTLVIGMCGLGVAPANEKVRKSYLEPQAQLKTALKIAPFINCMIDVSDGLAPEVKHICDESKCGAIIYKDKVPISDEVRAVARRLEEDEYDYALYGGEDFELVYTASNENLNKIKGFLVGEIIKNKKINLYSNGKEKAIAEKGYDHFSQGI